MIGRTSGASRFNIDKFSEVETVPYAIACSDNFYIIKRTFYLRCERVVCI